MTGRSWAHHAIDSAVLAVLLGLSLIALVPAYSGFAFAIAGGVGIVVGLAAGTVAAWRGWHGTVAAGLAAVGYFLFGGFAALRSTLVAGVVPGGATFSDLGSGVVTAWKDMLTVDTPIAGFDNALLVPYMVAIVCATAASYLAWHRRRAGWAIAPVAAMHIAAIAFGTYAAVAPVMQAVGAMAVAVGWLAWRRWHLRRNDAVDLASADDPAAQRLAVRRTALLGAGTLAASVVLGGAAAFALQPAGERQVLRDEVVPPFELRDYASPLQRFRAFVDDQADDVLITVDGLPPDARVRFATLDAYDGVVYGVAADGSRASGAFQRVGDEIAPNTPGTPATVRITIGELGGVWLPDVGEVRGVDFAGPRANELARSLYYNADTDTAVVTAGLASGDMYDLSVVIPAQPSEDTLASASVTNIALPSVQQVPESVAPSAIDIVGDATGQFAQIVALRDFLSSSGYFSHGLDGQAPSLSGHGAARISELLGGEDMIGDDEQYAVAFALLAHELGIPARVVLGAYPDADAQGPRVALTGDDVHVWVEVPFDDYGWVEFDPTPAEDDTLIDDEQDAQREPKPIVLQPPPPPDEPAKLPPTVPADDQVIDEPPLDPGFVLGIVIAALIVAGALFLLVAPAATVILLKMQRRLRRRRSGVLANRYSGGWEELVDRAQDHGLVLPGGATRQENGRRIDRRWAQASATDLAAAADKGVWGPGDPTAEDITEYWDQVDAVSHSLAAGLPWWRRALVAVSLRSLGGARSERAMRAVDRIARRKAEDDVLAR